MGGDGWFYFYNVLSKSLAAYGVDRITVGSGQTINWRSELIKKVLSLQKIDPKTGAGYWLNESGRWWEADPVLVTSYSLLALEIGTLDARAVRETLGVVLKHASDHDRAIRELRLAQK